MFVIITDGEENSSREYSADKIRSMIGREKAKYGWESAKASSSVYRSMSEKREILISAAYTVPGSISVLPQRWREMQPLPL